MVTLTWTFSALLTILVGILILAQPKLMRVLLGLYLIIVGVLNIVSI